MPKYPELKEETEEPDRIVSITIYPFHVTQILILCEYELHPAVFLREMKWQTELTKPTRHSINNNLSPSGIHFLHDNEHKKSIPYKFNLPQCMDTSIHIFMDPSVTIGPVKDGDSHKHFII